MDARVSLEPVPAMTGMRPVVDIMFGDFLGLIMDQLANQAAKMTYMSGGTLKVPLVMRAPVGSTRRGKETAPRLAQNHKTFTVWLLRLTIAAYLFLYFGLANESNDTLVEQSPLYKKDYQTRWAKYDKKAADKKVAAARAALTVQCQGSGTTSALDAECAITFTKLDKLIEAVQLQAERTRAVLDSVLVGIARTFELFGIRRPVRAART